MDHETFEVKGPWEKERADQYLAYDFWWHLGHDTMITSEWGTPNMVSNGVNPELLLGGKYGHALHVWNLRSRRHEQTLDLGAEQQTVLELRPAHKPQQAYGLVGVVSEHLDQQRRRSRTHGSQMYRSGRATERRAGDRPAGPYPLTMDFLPQLIALPSAAIVNVMTILSRDPAPHHSTYSAAMAALRSFSRSLRFQLEDTSVSVFDVLPAGVERHLAAPQLQEVGPEQIAEQVYQSLHGPQLETDWLLMSGLSYAW